MNFFSRPFWFFFSKTKTKQKNCFISMKTSRPFIWGIIYFCNMDGFFRILEKTSSKLICTRLYLRLLQRTYNPWMKNEPKDSKSHTQAPQPVAAVCYNTLKRRGGRGISERGRTSILSACIQQRSNVSGALAKDVESMVYRIKGHSSSAVVYHTKARQEDSLTNLQLGTV